MEILIVIIIIAAAAAYLIKTAVKGTGGGCSCGGSCPNCPPSEDCPEKRTEKF